MEQISKPRSHDAVSSATSRPPSRMGSKRESVRCTVAFALLMTWVAYFGTRTIRRCEDWMSERNLFESALQLCPQGIKTLNNLAAGMLNPGEAEKAEGLLQKAVEVRLRQMDSLCTCLKRVNSLHRNASPRLRPV